MHVQSGFKPRDSYQWSKYPKNPQIISLDAHGASRTHAHQTSMTQQTHGHTLNAQALGATHGVATSNGIHPPPSHTTASHIAPLSHNTNVMSGQSQVTM